MSAKRQPAKGTRPLGVSFMGIEEPAGEPCADCGKPGVPNDCLMSGIPWRRPHPHRCGPHRHGMTHVLDAAGRRELMWLCRGCYTRRRADHSRRMGEARG